MGRKRTSNKRNLNLWVDKDLVDQLYKLEYTPSVFFTDAVTEMLKQVEKGEIPIIKPNDDEKK